MASFLIYSASLSLALTFLCICKADLIQKVCSKATNPSFCKQTLTSDPRSRGADIRGLGYIGIDKALPPTEAVKNLAKKYRTKECIELADSAVDELRDCKVLLKTAHDEFNKSTLRMTASDASIDLETCVDDYGTELPLEIKRAIDLAQDLIHVLVIVVSFV